MTNRKRTTKPKTIGKLPPDLILPVTVKSLDDLVEKISRDAFKSAQDFFQGEGRSFICDMLLPDGTRFGDIMAVYPDGDCKSVDELVELLIPDDADDSIDDRASAA